MASDSFICNDDDNIKMHNANINNNSNYNNNFMMMYNNNNNKNGDTELQICHNLQSAKNNMSTYQEARTNINVTRKFNKKDKRNYYQNFDSSYNKQQQQQQQPTAIEYYLIDDNAYSFNTYVDDSNNYVNFDCYANNTGISNQIIYQQSEFQMR
jgi:hypothetical protein